MFAIEDKKTFVILVLSLFLAYLTWYNFSAALGEISQHFHLTPGETGQILSAFQLGYVTLVLASGWIVDFIGERKTMAWASLGAGISSLLLVFLARDFLSILFIRLLVGLFCGLIYVPGMSYLSKLYPPRQRGRILGGFTAALTLSFAGSYFIGGPLAAAFSWEVSIIWTSVPAVLSWFLILFWLDDAAERAHNEQPALEEDTKLHDDNRNMDLGDRNSDKNRDSNTRSGTAPGKPLPAPRGGYSGPVLITLGYMGHTWEQHAFHGWIGPFIAASALTVGMDSAAATSLGGQLSSVIITTGVVSIYLMGWLADRWSRTKVIITCALATFFVQLFFGFLHGAALSIVLIVGIWLGFWIQADSAVYKAGLADMVEIDLRAKALGFQAAAGYAMTVISPMAFGLILEAFNGALDNPIHANNWGLPFMVLAVGAFMTLASGFLLRRLPQSTLMGQKK